MPLSASNAGGGSIRSALTSTGVTKPGANSNVQKSLNKSISDSTAEAGDDPSTHEGDGTGEAGDKSEDQGDTAKDTDGKKATKYTSDQEFYAQQAALNREHQLKMAEIAAKQGQAGGMPDMGDLLKGLGNLGGGGQGGGTGGGTGGPKPTQAATEKPTQNNNNFTQNAQPVQPGSPLPENLKEAIKIDAYRMSENTGETITGDRAVALANDYLNSGVFKLGGKDDKEIGKNNDALRRLAMHGVELSEYLDVKNDPKNQGKTQSELVSLAISEKNEKELLSGSTQGQQTLSLMSKQLGFDNGELHSITAQQALGIHQDFLKASAAKDALGNNPSEEQLRDLGKNNAIILVSKDAEFDISSEGAIEKLKEMGVDHVFVMQVDNQGMLEDGSHVEQLAEKVGPFGTLVLAGHGGEDSAGLVFGTPGTKLGANDVLTKDDMDEADDPVRKLLNDRNVFIEGFTIIDLACNHQGNERIPDDKSMHAAFTDARGDANVYGPRGQVPSFSSFDINERGELFHYNIKDEKGNHIPLTLPNQDERPSFNFEATASSDYQKDTSSLDLSFGDFDEPEQLQEQSFVFNDAQETDDPEPEAPEPEIEEELLA